jgi:tRNA dimethylallyltransferase
LSENNTMPKPLCKIIAISGPTASGKTALAIRLAQEFGGEIVSADSMQVYRYLDIGTAKPTPAEQAACRHHLIDIVNPDEDYDAGRFSTDADRIIDELQQAGRIPFVVGGTGLYLRALCQGMIECPKPDQALRTEIEAELAARGIGPIAELLRRVDPVSMARIHPNDHYRLLRAYEIWKLTGQPASQLWAEHRFAQQRYDLLHLGLSLDRSRLYERIEERAAAMIRAGIIDEVAALLARGYSDDIKPLQSIYYKHVVGHLRGQIGAADLLGLIQRDTRRYAKRQLTWFRNQPEMVWFQPHKDYAAICQQIEYFLKKELIFVRS